MTIVRKAGKPAQVAVYDETGKLVGTVDQADISPIASASAPGGSDTQIAANTKRAASTAGVPGQEPAPGSPEVEAVTKALAGAKFTTDASGSTFAVLKGASDLDDQFERLLKSVDRATAGRLQDAVAAVALRMVSARRVSSQSAVRLAKRAAVEAGFAAARAESRTDGDVIAAIGHRIRAK